MTTKEPVALFWDGMHIQSREEMAVKAGFQAKIAKRKWADLEEWQRKLIQESIDRRSKEKALLADKPTKEPWQMTRAEFEKYRYPGEHFEPSQTGYSLVNIQHKIVIRKALSEGKPVPPEVLKDYPELGKTKGALYDKQFSEAMAQEAKREKEYAALTEKHMAERDTIRDKPRAERLDLTAKQQGEIEAFRAESATPKAKPPAPEVAKIAPTYGNLAIGQTLIDQAGDRWTITAINKEGVPGKWGYTIKGEKIDLTRTRPLGEIERYYKIEQPLAIPKAEQAPRAVETKPKPKEVGKRQKRTGVLTVSELQRIEASRSPLSRGMDESRKHSVVISQNSPKTKAWKHDQGTSDIQGIDTPRITKRVRLLSGRRIRITPRMGRLK